MVQLTISFPKSEPPAPDKTNSFKHNELTSPSTSRVVRTPAPEFIYVPENENPRTVLFPVDIVKPDDSASPPLAEITSTPST